MALPKEPRQKMINLMYLVLTALLALNVSAEVIEAFKTVDKSLGNSNANIDAANATLFKSFTAKKADPQTKANAEIWGAKADQAKDISDKFMTYLEDLKTQLKTASGLKTVEGKEEYKLDDLNASSRLMDTEKKGKDLDDKLRAYRAAMLNIDPEIKKQFEATFPVEVSADGKDNTTPSFRMMPTVAAITLLSKLQNNVKNAENQVVTFAHNKIGEVKVIYDQFAAIVGQSSNYVMPGEKVTVTAGVGAFSTAARPEISIGGAGATVDAEGKAVREFTAEGGGEKSIPVTVTYTKPNGEKESKSYTLKYTVGTPGGAAVMLDKMNVFYIGVDNPVTIGSPTGWDKTTVSMAGGSISGSGSKRTVRVSALGNASITVVADGKSSKFDFRVKRIPDPVFKVGSGKARVPAVEFKNQQFCRADLENFDFDLKYSVVSATVYFSGANFPNVGTGTISSNSLGSVGSLIAKCGPGSNITFVNIKVQGPDGIRSIDERSFTLY
ncbi:MAG: gliding motility protein GldM [Ferruginibacter sp.]